MWSVVVFDGCHYEKIKENRGWWVYCHSQSPSTWVNLTHTTTLIKVQVMFSFFYHLFYHKGTFFCCFITCPVCHYWWLITSLRWSRNAVSVLTVVCAQCATIYYEPSREENRLGWAQLQRDFMLSFSALLMLKHPVLLVVCRVERLVNHTPF